MKSLTLPRLVTLLAFIALFAMAVRTPVDTDMYWHLRAGQFILETRAIPAADPFSWTALGMPWIDVHWLSQVILYSTYAWLNMPGLALLVAQSLRRHICQRSEHAPVRGQRPDSAGEHPGDDFRSRPANRLEIEPPPHRVRFRFQVRRYLSGKASTARGLAGKGIHDPIEIEYLPSSGVFRVADLP